jgi:hypothetical protein
MKVTNLDYGESANRIFDFDLFSRSIALDVSPSFKLLLIHRKLEYSLQPPNLSRWRIGRVNPVDHSLTVTVLDPKCVPPILATQHGPTPGRRPGHSIRPNSVYNTGCRKTPPSNGELGEAQGKEEWSSDVGTEGIGDQKAYGVV